MQVSEGKSRVVRADGWPTSFYVAAGFVTVIAASFAATVFPPSATADRLLMLAVIIAGFSAIVRDTLAALVTAGLAWAFYLGFLVDRYGELHWHGGIDVLRAAVLLAAALIGSSLGRTLVRRGDDGATQRSGDHPNGADREVKGHG
jgi:MFS family permease